MKALLLIFGLSLGSGAFAAKGGGALPAEAKQMLEETQGEKAVVSVTDLDLKSEVPAAAEAAKPVDAKKAPENQIPLHLDSKATTGEGGGAWARITLGFFVLIMLGGGAYVFLRRLSRPDQRKNGPQIKILNQHWLGPKKSLAIIRVAGESILIGVTENNINLIKPLSLLDEEIPAETPDRFTHVMEDMSLKDQTIEEDGEDFQMSGLGQIKETVSRRLKNMRSFE